MRGCGDFCRHDNRRALAKAQGEAKQHLAAGPREKKIAEKVAQVSRASRNTPLPNALTLATPIRPPGEGHSDMKAAIPALGQRRDTKVGFAWHLTGVVECHVEPTLPCKFSESYQ